MDYGWFVAIILAYVVGSIPVGVILGRLKGVDIRQHGSRNVGATNVGRVLGRRLGLLCFALDMLKGTLPVLVSGVVLGVFGRPVGEHLPGVEPLSMADLILWLAVGVAAVLGHMYSVFLRFTGGKGVATGFGAMVAMWNLLTLPALLALVVWYTTLRLTKYVSLASILAAASLPLWCLLWFMPPLIFDQPLSASATELLAGWPIFGLTIILAAVVAWKHRANIGRIRRGEEPKVRGRGRRGDLIPDAASPGGRDDAPGR